MTSRDEEAEQESAKRPFRWDPPLVPGTVPELAVEIPDRPRSDRSRRWPCGRTRSDRLPLSDRRLHPVVHRLTLRRRGIDVMRGRAVNLMEMLTVGEAMQPVPAPVAGDLPLDALIAKFGEERVEALPVVDGSGTYVGTVTERRLEESARDNELDVTAGDLATRAEPLRRNQNLEEALATLVDHERSGLPVLSADGQRMVGWLTPRDVLRAYSTRLGDSVRRARQQPDLPLPEQRPEPLQGFASVHRPLAQLQGYRIIELELGREQPPVGWPVREVTWPRSSLLLAIRRQGRPFSATGDTVLEKGDRLTLLVPAERAEDSATIVNEIATPRPGREGS